MSDFLVDVEKVRRARHAMEREILGSVVSAVSRFKDMTGFTPERIDVDMTDMTCITSVMRDYVPCAVNATVNLEL